MAAMLVVGMLGCDRPLEVLFNSTGAKDLALRGESPVTGTLTRTLLYQGHEIPKDTKLFVSETFLIRREGGAPPSYHFKGLYDPAKRDDGFILPEGTIDTYYLCAVEPDRRQRIPVPKDYFQRDP